MKKLFLPFSLSLATALCALPVSAGSDSGFYIGGGIGRSSVELDAELADFDEDATGYKILAGYNFGLVPLVDLAVEADYRDFGSFETAGGAVETDATAFNVYGLAGLNFGLIGVFAKLGYSDVEVDADLGDFSFSDSESANSWGLGAKIHLTSFAIRAEYETFDVDEVDDLSMLSVSGTITF